MTKLEDLKAYPEEYPSGSIFRNEGVKLYELVKKLKPKKIIEVGTRFGCSTQFMALACKENGFGEIHTYDIEDHYIKKNDDLEPFIKRHLKSYFDETNKKCDFLFEDGAHTTGFTSNVLAETDFKVCVVHDYEHWDCQITVKKEALGVLGNPDEIHFEKPSDCGLAIWYK